MAATQIVGCHYLQATSQLTLAEQELADFEKRNSAQGRFERYASARIRSFGSRQVLTLLGSVVLALFVSPLIGILTALVALLGEVLDCGYLSRVPNRIKKGVPFEKLRNGSWLTAAVQALTIVFCASAAWVASDQTQTHFFAVVFLTGAALNAGLVLPHHPRAAQTRLVIYFATIFGLFIYSWFDLTDVRELMLFNLLATVVLIYTTVVFLRYVTQGYYARTSDKREVLHRKVEAAQSAVALAEQSHQARRLAHVAKHANDSVIITNTRGRIEYVNDTFTRLTGFSEAEALNQFPWTLLNGPETDPDTVQKIQTELSNHRPIRTEVLNYRKDGTTLWMETSLTPLLNDAGEVEMTIALERDISETKQRQAELARAKQAAEDGERAKSDFLAMMSHEIRTPMNGIIGMADMLSTTDLDTEQEGYARTIQASCEALLEVLNDILDFTLLERGKMSISHEPLVLSECIRQPVELLRGDAEQKGLTLTCTQEITQDKLLGDHVRIRQILMNLISNAIKFTENGGIDVHVRQRPDMSVEMVVRDTGVGITPEVQQALFEPFVQGDTSTTRTQDGTGLGLAICRKLASLMEGHISLKSTLGKGSEFTVTLPLKPDETKAHIATAIVPSTSVDLPSGVRILAAEDNRTNRLLLSKMLTKSGAVVEFAENGAIAVEKWRTLSPDIILMDLSMPEMSGLQATKAIRAEEQAENKAETLIIALTANAFESDRKACLAAGMNAFLTKPVRRKELFCEMRRQLSQRPLQSPSP